MKQMKRILYMTGILSCACLTVAAQELADVKIVNEQVQRENRQVNISLTLDLTDLHVGTQQSVRLKPVIIEKEGERQLELAPIVVDGHTRSLVHQRQQALTGSSATDGAGIVVRRRNGKEQQVDYTATVAYEPWMLQSRLALRQEVTGCLECAQSEGIEVPLKNTLLQAYAPRYATAFVQPPKDSVKTRTEQRVARLQYRQDSHKIDPKYKNNQEELDKVTHSIEVVKQDPDLTITGIYIKGWASPEGSVEYNKRLSQRRADALAEYARKDTHTDASLWHVSGMGEDWEGLREEVQKHPKLLKIDEVLRIIDECNGDQDACEKRIRALVPPTIYQRVLNEMYGPLRRNEYLIVYSVRNFNLEEARRQIKTRPDLLNVTEMYAVANSYGKGTPEYDEALLTAARLYPANASAVVNAAVVLMERDDLKAAIQLMENSQATQAPEVLNALGVAYAQDKQYAKAGEVLRQAVKANSTEAARNLEELSHVLEEL